MKIRHKPSKEKELALLFTRTSLHSGAGDAALVHQKRWGTAYATRSHLTVVSTVAARGSWDESGHAHAAALICMLRSTYGVKHLIVTGGDRVAVGSTKVRRFRQNGVQIHAFVHDR